jgi:hypothetical protein
VVQREICGRNAKRRDETRALQANQVETGGLHQRHMVDGSDAPAAFTEGLLLFSEQTGIRRGISPIAGCADHEYMAYEVIFTPFAAAV